MNTEPERLRERTRKFLSKATNTDKPHLCWEWTACSGSQGYGNTRINNRSMLAHRVSYVLFVGEIPEGMCVLHRCDNRKCINPAHLFLGTYQDNSDDMIAKDRNSRGTRHTSTKLTEWAIELMRSLYASGKFTHVDLGRMFMVHTETARRAIHGEQWRHVPLLAALEGK